MPTRDFDFTHKSGERLAGSLELPVGPAHGWALFAHCFTCGKDGQAAVRIARRLAGAGIGVLRFDFAGIGESEGEFTETSFTRNLEDIVAAAAAMAAAGMPPGVLVGHSLGGAAVLAAAHLLPDIRAVTTIGAPFDIAHLLGQADPETIKQIADGGSGTITLGGRAISIGRALVEDLRNHDQSERIATLRRPLLLLHSPTDQIVGIDNVTRIFLAARHPKSFVSLDGADHMLSGTCDADFAADIIAAWAHRYLPEAEARAPSDYDAEAEETGLGKFQLALRAGGASFIVDEPPSMGGLGSGPTPFNLLSAALAACTTMTLRLFATKHGLPAARIRTRVTHHKDAAITPPDIFTRRITIEGPLDDAQRAAMLGAADRCPVHRTLEQGSRFAPAEAD